MGVVGPSIGPADKLALTGQRFDDTASLILLLPSEPLSTLAYSRREITYLYSDRLSPDCTPNQVESIPSIDLRTSASLRSAHHYYHLTGNRPGQQVRISDTISHSIQKLGSKKHMPGTCVHDRGRNACRGDPLSDPSAFLQSTVFKRGHELYLRIYVPVAIPPHARLSLQASCSALEVNKLHFQELHVFLPTSLHKAKKRVHHYTRPSLISLSASCSVPSTCPAPTWPHAPSLQSNPKNE